MWLERQGLVFVLCLCMAGCASTGGVNSGLAEGSAAQQRRSAAEIHTELGRRYMQRGQLETAMAKLTKALQFDPSFVPAHTVIAVLYERIGKLTEAEQHYRKAEELAPSKGAVNNNLGHFLCKVGRVDESLTYFKKAVADPFYDTPAAAYANAGTCLLKVQRPAAAQEQLAKALEIAPKDPGALYQMASALVQQQDYFHALAYIQRFDALGHPQPAALLLGYTIERQLGEREAAQSYSDQLRKLFPDSEQARSLQRDQTP